LVAFFNRKKWKKIENKEERKEKREKRRKRKKFWGEMFKKKGWGFFI